MDSEVKRRWVQALRSGEYKQGVARLRNRNEKDSVDKFCCLGVLCELAVAAGVEMRATAEQDYQGDTRWVYGEERNSTALPNEVLEWSGLDSTDPDIELNGHRYELSQCNDSSSDCVCTDPPDDHLTKGVSTLSFTRIADLIEAQL